MAMLAGLFLPKTLNSTTIGLPTTDSRSAIPLVISHTFIHAYIYLCILMFCNFDFMCFLRLDFKYDKDSVLVVEEGDYDKCDSAHPIFFSNNGNTVYTLDHSGAFYFISGIAEHCQKGQKMIIRVMGHSEGPGSSPDAGNHTGTHNVPSSSPNGSGGGLYEGFHAMHVSLLWVFFMFLGSLLF